ncbi:MAG: hypothetical protein M3331_00555 [Actinomycetota bacterium]|nr:hypothetical protein [Actinomycetota bacterium]
MIPKRAFENAGLRLGDRLKAVAEGSGEVRFYRVAREAEKEIGPPGGGPIQRSFNEVGG